VVIHWHYLLAGLTGNIRFGKVRIFYYLISILLMQLIYISASGWRQPIGRIPTHAIKIQKKKKIFGSFPTVCG
jgi:hypothetical protein